jgi:phosphinothricin acetyltransferase
MDDCDDIALIYNQYVGKATMDLEKREAHFFSNWITKMDDREVATVFENENKLQGWGVLKKYSDRLGYQYAGETSVFVSNNHRNQKVGSAIKKDLIDRARTLRYKHLVAKIWSTNKISINYNLKLGYEIVGTQRKIGYVDHQWIDVVIMQLVLDK